METETIQRDSNGMTRGEQLVAWLGFNRWPDAGEGCVKWPSFAAGFAAGMKHARADNAGETD